MKSSFLPPFGSLRPLASAAAACLAATAAPALAQDGGDPVVDMDRDTVTIGAGVGYVPSYEGSDDYVVVPVGAVRGRVAGMNFFTRGTSLFLDVLPSDGPLNFEAGPVVGVRFDRNFSAKRMKDPQVAALGKLKKAWEVGGFVGVTKTGVITSDYDSLSFRLAYVHDVGDAHESYVLTPSIEYGTPLSRHNYVGVQLTADYVGKGYGDYYFNVTQPGSLASNLPAYGAANDSGFKKVGVGLVGIQSLTGDLTGGLSLVVLGGYCRLLGDYARSPVVSVAGSRNQWAGGVGLAYTF